MINKCQYSMIGMVMVCLIPFFAACAIPTGDTENNLSGNSGENNADISLGDEGNFLGQRIKYGVFIGVTPDQSPSFAAYDLVVIDAAYYDKTDIDKIRQAGTRVYSYLNVGSIEHFREFFPEYQHLILGEYENWAGEYWVDVSSPEWQNHVHTQAARLVEKGIDGFFVDNADVYYYYHRSDIFQGMVAILSELGQYQKDILINGGDVLVSEVIMTTDLSAIPISGVNQECVFTNIDFEHGKLIPQNVENMEYYQEYLERCSRQGWAVYLLEYSEDKTLIARIEEYCNAHQFEYYVSSSIDLQL